MKDLPLKIVILEEAKKSQIKKIYYNKYIKF